MTLPRRLIKSAFTSIGLDIRRLPAPSANTVEESPQFDGDVMNIITFVKPFTMTSPERLSALCAAVRYIVSSAVDGAFVECGVWRGGSMMAAALELKRQKQERDIHLFDTFDGMSEPTQVDRSYSGEAASQLLATEDKETSFNWAYCPEDQVRQNLASTGYNMSRVHFVKGKVEETIPQHAPQHISLLRLDTDWYESTRHELIHLFPRLQRGGVLIIDDYGHWEGARKAVDEYIATTKAPILLNRVDYTGRIAVKCF